MFCSNCGAAITTGQNFCSNCGKQLVAGVAPSAQAPPTPPSVTPLPPALSRIEKHTKILAILWLAVSVFGLIPSFWFFFGSGMAMHFIPLHLQFGFPLRAFLWPIAGAIGIFLLASAVLGLLAGWGLLNYRPWARVLALILGVISLIHFPFGTALGIYTLWVLLPAESEREYQRLARTAN
ncbi:MAG: zinc ribbon domain-containing protein [Acidobacteria bacterium]|nr:zinc ribbon domain-containing protein [Acidobacteriota bacterium]